MKLYPWKYARIIGQRFMQDLRDRSYLTLRLWTDHCEYIMAQRLRRGQQIITFYDRIWGEKAFKELIKGLRRQVQRNMKSIMLSSVGIYAFDWESNRIHNDVLKTYLNEIDFVEKLRKETLICMKCHKRKIISEKFEDVEYCKCPYDGVAPGNCSKKSNCAKNETICKTDNSKLTDYSSNNNNIDCELHKWEPYLEKKDMIIWRKEEKPSLYAYKVHVKYTDVTAEDFLQVQTDIEYRKKWDDTAIALEIIDSDPEDIDKCQIIYWEMRWPKLFANRDYVYIRQYYTDKKRNLIVIYNKSTNHPKCPVNPNKQRVNEYWSYMVIKPFQTFQKPGLEFVLTYFDDPGLAIPSAITSWVAQKQMPEFLTRLYHATKEFSEYKKQDSYKKTLKKTWDKYHMPSQPDRTTEVNSSSDKQHRRMKMNRGDEHENNDQDEFMISSKHPDNINNNNSSSNNNSSNDTKNNIDNADNKTINYGSTTIQDSENTSEQENKSWWSYLRPLYYFA